MQELPTVKSAPGAETGVATIPSATQGPTASDFFRPLRMSAEANRSTLGVETDSVTPELLMAASSKLLAINRREAESDPKDSMEFQRVYGPADYFAEHILRDGSRVARQLLWKATNKGGLDFMPVGALDQHVSDVFNSSKLANMVDGSSPLELVEAAMKITRVGEGGVGDVQSAPDEMRLVQPSFLGFIDPVRSVESLRVGLDAYLTKHCMKGSDGKLYQWFVNARTGKRELLDSVTAARSVITTPDEMKRTTRNVFALGGRTGVRVVPRDSVDYYLPNMDDAFTTASNLVPGLSSVKELRLLMGCLHPATPVMRLNGSRLLELVPASEIAAGDRLVTSGGEVKRVRTVVTRLPLHGMVRVRTLSGRVALVTPDHRWPVLGEDGEERLVPTSKLRRGDRLVRMLPASLPCRRSFVQGLQVTAATGLVLGTALRSLERTEDGAARLLVAERHLEAVTRELERRSAEVSREPDAEWEGAERLTVTGDFARWLLSACLAPDGSRVTPPELLGAEPKVASSALDAYTADLTLVAEDADEGMWLVDIPTPGLRQALAILAGRSGLDSDYRDGACRALRLRPADLTSPTAADPVASVTPVSGGCPAVIDIDVDDATYALGCGLVTHNSKYPQQAVSIEGREPPLVRGLDAASGKDMQSVIGRYLGALYAPKAGTVRAVRRDRVDMDYDDGTRGSIALYRSFPMNAKGLIESTARVKAGDRLEKGGLIASSNYTDDRGVAAVGTNLRTGWLSWKGGTYEDAIVLSETAARKLTSTTMYQTALDLDRTVQLGRDNYTAWKPSEFSAEQLAALDRDGVVRPGTVLRKGDPMVLAVRVTQPSPGTMGRRVLDDLSETWQHDHPGVVTDVLRTRKGVKVLATVTAPLEVGDKISGSHGNKGIVSMVLPDDQMPKDASGQPLEVILSPLGLVSRCYHPDTELRTQDGWRAIADVRDDDLVAQLDPLTLIETLVPQTAPMHSAPFEGELIGYDDGEVSFLVTPRHTIPVFSTDGGASAITAEKAFGTDLLVVVAGADSPDAPEPGLPVTRHLRADAWRRVPYAGPVICPSVPSGVVATRLGGHRVCLGNTNPAQLHETLLGKVARRTGKFEVLPAFPDGNVREHVLRRLKETGLKADDDFFDPEDGRRIPNVVNGYTYFYKLKHLAESKLSARGTDEYSSDETPGGSGYEGCFPAAQEVITAHGPMSIAHICENRLPVAVLTWDDQAGWCYRQVTDWFARHADVGEILNITTEFNLSACGSGGRNWVRHTTSMYPTRNHVLYRADMTRVAAGDVRQGDLLASFGYVPTEAQRQVIVGTLLGDAYIDMDGNLECMHSKAQREWIRWKHQALRGLGATLPVKDYRRNAGVRNGKKIRSTFANLLRMPHNGLLAELEGMMVDRSGPRARRRVTRELLDMIGELGFCVWFIDDGSMTDKRTSNSQTYRPEAALATNGFTPDETRVIASWLEEFLELPAAPSMPRCDHADGTEAYSIRFSRDASWKILRMVARNIPWDAIPESKKLLRQFCRDEQDAGGAPAHDFLPKPGVVPVRVRSVKPYHHDNPKYTSIMVYDMTVDDTHRYALSGGNLVSNSKRLGSLEVSALAGHAAFDVLADAKLIRGQRNSEFWRSIRTGGIPTMPGEPLVQRKFFAHLQGSGVNVRKTPKGISVFALSDDDVRQMAGPRELRSRDTYEARTFRPLDGGLFGQDVFGPNGDRWAYIQLDEPLPNPVMADPLARLLRLSDRDFEAVCTGSREVDGMASSEDVRRRLAGIDLDKESAAALDELRDATKSRRPAALKRYLAVERMRRQGVSPDQYMLTRLPVLPPVYRPISSHAGVTMVADANYLYAQMLDARDDLRAAASLPAEYRADARRNLWRSWQELTGMYDPEDVKLRSKNVGGLLQWALGKGSPKFSAFSRKVLGTSVDTVGRGVIQPDARLTIDEIGMPADMAFDTMAPFVTRALVKRGYTPVAAMGMVKDRHPQALDALKEVMATHPVLLNRAPTLHKYSIMAFRPVLVPGKTLHIHPSVCPGLAADFDGDSIENRLRLVFELDALEKKVEENGKDSLTPLESRVYSVANREHGAPESNRIGEDKMIKQETKCRFADMTCRMEDVPTVAGSMVQRGNVTEWDVPEGVFVDTVDPQTGERVLAPMTKVSRHTGLRMFDVYLSSKGSYGHVVTASDDHSLITASPVTGKLEKTRPEDCLGRLVPRVIRGLANGPERCLRTVRIGHGLQASHELGFVIGVIVGDGWVDSEDCLRIACAVPELQSHLLDLLRADRQVLPVTQDARAFRYATTEQRFGSTDMQRITVYTPLWFRQALRSAIGTGATAKRLPEDCLHSSRAHMAGVLMGLLATDGSVNHSKPAAGKKSSSKSCIYHTTSVRLRDDLQELCLRLGIRTGVTPYRGVNSTTDCYAITLSLEDLVREMRRTPSLFQMHHAEKQAALDRIAEDMAVPSVKTSHDLVPFPAELRGPCVYCGVNTGHKDVFNRAIANGYTSRAAAEAMLQTLERFDLSGYVEPTSLPKRLRMGLSAEQAQAAVDTLRRIVREDAVTWELVTDVRQSQCTEGWDCTVPGPYTFTLAEGTVVQDTVNVHVPVSDAARRQAWDRMRPSRNLLGLADHGIMNKPEKEYMQGLYIASRMREGERPRDFRSLKEAQEAYRRGDIEVDTPIRLLDR